MTSTLHPHALNVFKVRRTANMSEENSQAFLEVEKRGTRYLNVVCAPEKKLGVVRCKLFLWHADQHIFDSY